MTVEHALPREIEIRAQDGGSRALVAPSRGGMVTAWEVDGAGLFSLDRDSFLDETKNVRGGSPVLFPTPGKLLSDRWTRDGQGGSLRQHGFARNLPWEVVEAVGDRVRLRLTATPATLADYPWDFAVELSYRVVGRALLIDARIENRSVTEMPFGFGFHPYFRVEDRLSFTLESEATRAFDNVTKREVPFDRTALELGARELDLHLLDHGASTLRFAFDRWRITLEGSSHYVHWVLWSLPGREFACVEPWTCPGDAMNTGVRLLRVPPGEMLELALALRAEPQG